MKKNQLLLILAVLLLLLIGGYLYLTRDVSKTSVLEINFISDHPIEENRMIPNYLNVFAQVFEDESGNHLISRLSFKRVDIGSIGVDSIQFSKPINSSLSHEEAQSLFDKERASISATSSMLQKKGDEKIDYSRDTTNIVHFYLDMSNTAPDNILTFNSASVLKNHIDSKLKEGNLFLQGLKPNSITVVLLSGNKNKEIRQDEIEIEKPEPDIKTENEIEQSKPIDPKVYSAAIKVNGNNISWNRKLADAENLTITFTSNVDGKVLVSENVTGTSSYYFSYSNSIYEASSIKIQLKGSFEDGSTITNSSKSTSELECH